MVPPGGKTMPTASIDFDKFRLRPFVDRLIEMGEVEIHDEPVPLANLTAIIEATPKATLFRNAGPQGYELVASVSGGPRRLAAAFGVEERNVAQEFARRMAKPQPVVEVPSKDAPVHQVMKTGDAIDLTSLPFHVQHEMDGGTYISSGIDYSVDPATGKRNVGCRRLMLRDRRTMRSNLSQESDLKHIYLGCVKRGEKLPVSFAIGSHPLDYVAAGLRLPADEFGLVGTLRGEPVPMVRGVTNGVLAPADAEMIIEGYFDELGYCEKEGPYGEFWGFYGPVHMDPVFHVTAIAMRKDVLYQSVLHGHRRMERMESTHLSGVSIEAAAWRTLRAANIEPVAVYSVAAAPARQHMRVALRRGSPGQARLAISALFGLMSLRHVVIVDEDVDPRSDTEVEWAMATRFRADRDTVIASGYPAFYMDPTVDEAKTIAKIGFDATAPYGRPETIEDRRPLPPRLNKAPRYQTVRQALEAGPLYFLQIMEAIGSDDGREVALELDALREQGILDRLPNGEWILTKR
jgi:2,5-furandicarboxylate decarboxylase 1